MIAMPEARLRLLPAIWLLCWESTRKHVAGLAFCTIATGLLPAAAAWLTKLTFDALTGHGDARSVLAPAGGLAVIGLAAGLLPQLSNYLKADVDRGVSRTVQDRLYRTVNGFSGLSRFESPDFLDRLRLAAQSGGASLTPLTTGAFAIAKDFITLVSVLATLVVISWPMAIVVILVAAPAFAGQIRLARLRISTRLRLSPVARRQILFGALLTNAQAAMEIRLFDLGEFLRRRLLGYVRTAQQGDRHIDQKVLRTQALLNLLTATTAGIGLVAAAFQAWAGTLSLGDVTAFVAAVAAAQGAVSGLVVGLVGAHEALLAFGIFADVCSTPDDLHVPADNRSLPPLRTGIELRDVWFRYGNSRNWVLRGVDLHIPYGRTVGLVGVNGAGKSTLVKLLCRFYDPVRGSIHWDGVDIRDVPPDQLRARMSVLFQDFVRYDLTAAENIGIGDLSAEPRRIGAAATNSGVAQTIERLPRGYQTMLTRIFLPDEDDDADPGVMLSGGQWQRIALARSLIRGDRDLLILDEPSSGLDARAEHEIAANVAKLRAGRTGLLVSHRLGNLRDADHIVVLDEGKVAENGTHEELLALRGHYADLFTMQASGYQPDPKYGTPKERVIT